MPSDGADGEGRSKLSQRLQWWLSTSAQLLVVAGLSGAIAGMIARYCDGGAANRLLLLLVGSNVLIAWYAGMLVPIIKGGRFDAQ